MPSLNDIDTTSWGVDKPQNVNIPKIIKNFEVVRAAGTSKDFISSAEGKATPADTDSLPLNDSANDNALKKLTWANLKAALTDTFAPLNALAGKLSLTGGTMTGAINEALVPSMALASTMDIGAQAGNYIIVTAGTGPIASFGTIAAGARRKLRFAVSATITYHATNLLIPGAADLSVSVGDVIECVSGGGGIWRITDIQPWGALPINRGGTGATTAADAAVSLGIIGKNKIINGNFAINQRAVSGTVTLLAGAYGHDRWKAGSSGCTYTFTTVNNITTITITAGSILQIIEGLNLFTGTHVLSWQGTSLGKIGGGSYGSSGITGVVTGGTNLNIEFGVGTLKFVQLEQGSVATLFESRNISQELMMCQRYYLKFGAGIHGQTDSSTGIWISDEFPVPMRIAPTPAISSPITIRINGGDLGSGTTIAVPNIGLNGFSMQINGFAGLITSPAHPICERYGVDWLTFNAEL